MDWPLLASLGDEERREVLATTRQRRFARGEVLVHEGDPSDSLHLVESGRLAVQVTTADGDTATLNVLGPGDYFGELSLLGGRSPTRTASVVALEQATTRTLSESAFRELRHRHRSAEQLLLVLLTRRVEELSARLVEVMYDGLDRRLFRRLLELTDLYAEGSAGPVDVPLTQELLAELVGGTRPSVNQVLQRLVAEGVVALGRGRVTVVDRAALARKAG
jgi:CRP-like cAMP-binding protein